MLVPFPRAASKALINYGAIAEAAGIAEVNLRV